MCSYMSNTQFEGVEFSWFGLFKDFASWAAVPPDEGNLQRVSSLRTLNAIFAFLENCNCQAIVVLDHFWLFPCPAAHTTKYHQRQ